MGSDRWLSYGFHFMMNPCLVSTSKGEVIKLPSMMMIVSPLFLPGVFPNTTSAGYNERRQFLTRIKESFNPSCVYDFWVSSSSLAAFVWNPHAARAI
jgi:hypothetical protein